MPLPVSDHPAVDKYAKHINPAFVKLLGAFGYGRVFVRASGARLWDHEGREYIDFLSGFGAHNIGHNHPVLREKLREFLLDDVPNLVHVGPPVYAAQLAEELTRRTGPLTSCLFSCTGSDAVEAALKLARAATGKKNLVYCQNGYHGLNLGTLSVNGVARMRDLFEPLVPSCEQIPFGDLGALERILAKKHTAAFLVEPIQAEGGMVMPPSGFLRSAQDLCRKYGALLVLDEVQTGIGRTGTLFACETDGFFPDILVLGKALGAGMTAISATVTTPELQKRAFGTMERFDLHGSTYAGNAFSCRAASAILQIVDDEKLVEASKTKGVRLMQQLNARLSGHPLVKEIRGRGLFVGIELGPTQQGGLLHRALPLIVQAVSKHIFGQWLAVRLLEEGVIAQPSSQQWNVLKLEPPLTVTNAEMDTVVEKIGTILDQYRDVAPIIRDATERLGKQAMGGWRFG
jgi:putrescine aminotransferase